MAFTVIVVGDPVLASVAMGNWRNVNYGNALLPVDATGNGVNNTIAAGSSSYRFSNTYSVLGNFSGQITSTLTTGTAPFSIASTTKVANLNADFLDDQTGSYYQNSDNQSAGTLPSGRLAGSYTGITGVGSLTVSGNAVINGTALGWDASLVPYVQVGNTLSLIGVAGSQRIYNNLYYDGVNKYASGTTVFGSVWSFDTSTGDFTYSNTSSAGNAGAVAPTLDDRFAITKTGKIIQQKLSAGGEVFLQTISTDTAIFNRMYNNSNTGTLAYGLENSTGGSVFTNSDPCSFCFFVPTNRHFNWIIDTTRVLRLTPTGMGFEGATVTGKINLADHTTAAGGLYIGSDVTLYRSAANVLKTDDALVVTGGIDAGANGTTQKYIDVQIGDWDMDANYTTSVAVGGGVTLNQILSWHVTIHRDGYGGSSSYKYDLNWAGSSYAFATSPTTPAGVGNIGLERDAAGLFDSTDFNSTSFNRGYVRVWYSA